MRLRSVLVFAALMVASSAASAAPILASDLIMRNNSANLQFGWRVPPEIGIIPPLFNEMRAKAEAGLAAGLQTADYDAAEARKSGQPTRQYTDITFWIVAADTPRLLAVTGQIYGYTGGAHGNTGYDSVLWDRKLGKLIGVPDLFADRAKARAILEPMVCKALAAEQAKRRGGQKLGGDFDKCPPLAQATIVPFSGFSPVATQVRVIFAPYVAGPYVEGSYEITLPWPDEVKPLVKPEYREELFGIGQ
jgi:hypothetical protein